MADSKGWSRPNSATWTKHDAGTLVATIRSVKDELLAAVRLPDGSTLRAIFSTSQEGDAVAWCDLHHAGVQTPPPVEDDPIKRLVTYLTTYPKVAWDVVGRVPIAGPWTYHEEAHEWARRNLRGERIARVWDTPFITRCETVSRKASLCVDANEGKNTCDDDLRATYILMD